MKNKSPALPIGIFLLIGLLASGCGGSDSASDSGIIQGVASKGLINDGTVTVFAVNVDGTIGTELGSGQTDADGQYSIDVGDYYGPVLVVVTGGTYTDEATGLPVANNQLRAAIPAVGGTVEVAVTPLTEIAVQLAGATLTVSQINNSNAAVAVLIGGADITETQPPDINGDMSGNTDAEKDYTMILAAISQMVEDGSATDVEDAIAIIKGDLEGDGQLTFDGVSTGDALQGAVENFLVSDENTTGLTLASITLDDNIHEAGKFILTIEEWDDDINDGEIDAGEIDKVFTYTYDADGKLTMTEQDGDYAESDPPNGTANHRTTYTYDEDGNMTFEWFDFGADDFYSASDDYFYYTYDDDGNMTLYERDSNHNGVGVDYRRIHTYDANGNNTMIEYDTSNNGKVNYRVTFSYDADGNMYLKEIDTTADGDAEYTIEYSYDENGNITTEDDLDGEGAVGGRIYYSYGANGKLSTKENDSDMSGEPFYQVETYIYDAYGNMTRYRILEEGTTAETKYTWEQL